MKRKNTQKNIKKYKVLLEELIKELANLDESKRIVVLNKINTELHNISPFNKEPVNKVKWVKIDKIMANDYNPNAVAPPEMELLKTSIEQDGYTQPIVVWYREDINKYEVVDGFHRNRVGREYKTINERIKGFLPVVVINNNRTDRNDRIASTIRHNRARGKHNVDSMTDIVVELKRRNWSNAKISKNLGMDSDEILRLCQVSGLQEMFSDDDFTQSWDIDMMSEEDIDFVLSEDNIEPDKEMKEGRILHTYEKWECHKAGFYSNKPPKGMTKEQCEERYKELLTNVPLFKSTLKKVINEWTNSCEHYLTNDTMNRIAWLGQACLCYEYGIPSCFRSGYSKLTKQEQYEADKIALKYLNLWLKRNKYETINNDILTNKPKADLY